MATPQQIMDDLIFFEKESTFNTYLGAGCIPNQSIVLIRESGKIYSHGQYFSDYESIRKALFEDGEGSVKEQLQNLKTEILGGVSKKYNTLKKIEEFLETYNLKAGKGIDVTVEGEISAKVDNESIKFNDKDELSVGVIDAGEF